MSWTNQEIIERSSITGTSTGLSSLQGVNKSRDNRKVFDAQEVGFELATLDEQIKR